MKTKKDYIAPQLTVVSFKIEQGFAQSGEVSLRLFQDAELDIINNNYNDYNEYNQENWHQGSSNIFGSGW